jgi:cyanophycinase
MTGPIALVGGGEFTEGCVFDRGLLDGCGADEVAVVAAAAAFENPARLVARARSWFASLGVRVLDVPVRSRGDGMVAENIAAVRDARFVYLPSGSPMHLRSVLKDSPLCEALIGMNVDGGVIAGSGAGADVLCDPMVDTRGGAFTVGLGLLPGLAVIPRANTWSHDKVRRTVELAPVGVVVVAVPEATAIIRDGSGWRTEGVGEPAVYVDGALADFSALPT